jgi:dolichol-phosphate mannosyltransferase
VNFIALPAYNEEEALPRLLARIAAVSKTHFNNELRVIIANDGSKDNTAGAARAAADAHGLCCEIITHEVNKGLGGAIKTALTTALARSTSPNDVIITMDSDDTHIPGLIPRMVMMIEEGNDLVIASRYQHGARMLGIPWYRQVLSTHRRRARLFMRLPRLSRQFVAGHLRPVRRQAVCGTRVRVHGRPADQDAHRRRNGE